MAALQRTYPGAEGDFGVGGPHEQDGAAPEPGQDPETAQLREEK